MKAKNPRPKSSKLLTFFNPILSFFKPNHRETRFMDLPRVIMVEILSKLPIAFILSSRRVCKLWYNLFFDPLFLTMYRSRLPPPCILFSRDHGLIGSCNGFIGLITNIFDINTSVYISNSLLGEYFKHKLPKLEKSDCGVVYRFCFSELSGKYKLPKTNNHHEVSELEVYTLGGDEKWRNLGQVPYPVWHDFGQVCVNRALHWMDPVNKDSIYSFDIETEKLKSVPGSPGLVFPFRLQKQSDGSNLVEVDLSLGCSSAYPDEQADSQDHDEQADNQNHSGDNSDRSTPFPSINRDSSINSLIRCSRSHYGTIAALNCNFR
ncbi:hypothetical protein BC332_27898 [Capsicum chinense]|nr:hypothetical protein BC332_27898 [Capsicum chinense]